MTQTAVALEKLGQILKIENAKETQVAGSHYKNRKMEPLDFLQEVAVYYGYTIASATKYLLRYKNKGQWQDDLLKIAHYSRLHEMEQDQVAVFTLSLVKNYSIAFLKKSATQNNNITSLAVYRTANTLKRKLNYD